MISKHEFSHPYTPYKIQLELMEAIYETIENGYKVGIFESPTGTGKTLSIICSSMTWLRTYKKNHTFDSMEPEDSKQSEEEDDDEPEWVKNDYRSSILERSKNKLKDYEIYLDNVQHEYENDIHEVTQLKAQSSQKRRKANDVSEQDDTKYLPQDYNEVSKASEDNLKIKKEIDSLLGKANSDHDAPDRANECPIKIYFSSRTHSQLNQFSNQLKLTSFSSSFEGVNERIKYLPLGSRKQLCINPKVLKYSKNDAINDACVDLQNSKEGCEFLPKDYMNSSLTSRLSDLSLTKIHDIEELSEIGTNLRTCPYYTARRGVEKTEIISLPYQMLLQDSTRAILGLNIENAIIIIDEAHNILDVINSIYSVSISKDEISSILKSLKVYTNKFIGRLNSGNRINLMKLIKLCQTLISFIEKSSTAQSGEQILVQELLGNSNGDLVNIHKIETFLNKTKIAYKIETYIEKVTEETEQSSSNPLLLKMVKFLKCIANPSKEGKFFWDKSAGKVSINYMLLDPSQIFKDIVDKAKCVLLCGGTMEPTSDYTDYLFPFLESSKIKKFSCGHIIPDEHLKVFPINENQGTQFDFSFGQRSNTKMLEILGETILQLCDSVPFGVVVFFPSYKYLDQVVNTWKKSTKNIYDRIENSKKIFTESKDVSNSDNILDQYSNTIQREKTGSILFSVVGGKMSEGINFSDDLARAIIMIGLPYPNAYSGEIIAKRNFIEDRTIKNGGTAKEAKENSHNFYEGLCMKSVNQSIGRSIRHINDYSVIYLIDQRYSNPRIQQKLSGWVKDRIQNKSYSMQEITDLTRDFFSSKSVTKLI